MLRAVPASLSSPVRPAGASSMLRPAGLALVAALVLATTRTAFAADPATPPPAAAPPVFSPFGPAWDPTRPAPVEPGEKGPGITAATVVASGPADVEQLRGQAAGALPYFAVVLDVSLAAGSTTAALGSGSVTLEREGGVSSPLKAACTPTMDSADAVWRGGGSTIVRWDIAVGGRTWLCGGRTARMAIVFGDGAALRLSTPAAADWKGPLVLLFEPRVEAARHVVLPGMRVELAPADSSVPKDGAGPADASPDSAGNAAGDIPAGTPGNAPQQPDPAPGGDR